MTIVCLAWYSHWILAIVDCTFWTTFAATDEEAEDEFVAKVSHHFVTLASTWSVSIFSTDLWWSWNWISNLLTRSHSFLQTLDLWKGTFYMSNAGVNTWLSVIIFQCNREYVVVNRESKKYNIVNNAAGWIKHYTHQHLSLYNPCVGDPHTICIPGHPPLQNWNKFCKRRP